MTYSLTIRTHEHLCTPHPATRRVHGMSTDPSPSEPTTVTVARAESGWVARVYGADTQLPAETPLTCNGVAFYAEGLDALARSCTIPGAFAYEGAKGWSQSPDNSYSAVLHQIDRRLGA